MGSCDTSSTLSVRKVGDTLILSGQLSETTPLPGASWAGAVARLLVTNTETGVVTTLTPVTLDVAGPNATPQTPAKYFYKGAGVALGDYTYTVQVTFSDNSVLTWPNTGDVFRLKVIA